MPRKKAAPSLKLVQSAKPDLCVHSDYAEVSKSALAHLAEHADDVFRFGDRLAFVKRGDDGAPRIHTAGLQDIRLIVADHMQPFRITKEGRKEIALQEDVAKLMLAAKTDIAAFRPLVGVTTAPLLREDGTIHLADGYDEESQLFCDYTQLPPLTVPERPSREEAEASLLAMRKIFAETPFADRTVDRENPEATDFELPPGQDESAFHNVMMLGIARASLPAAPGHVARGASGQSGAGKSTITRAVAFTAFGCQPTDTAFASDMVEFDKQLTATLRRAPLAVHFDNGNDVTLRSNLLNMAMTSGHAQSRVLGSSDNIDLMTRALLLFNGNAIDISADDIRRLPLISDLDARTEDPEARVTSTDDFLERVIKPRRGELLGHYLTIWRWGRHNESAIAQGRSLKSYETFCRWIRDPLLALGCKDPALRIEELKRTDPERDAKITIFREWWRASQRAGDGLQTVPVTVHGLDAGVCTIIDPNYGANKRRKVAHDLARWRGVRVGGFVLESNATTKGKHSATKYWLTRQEPLPMEHENPAPKCDDARYERAEPEPEFPEVKEPPRGAGYFQIIGPEPDHPCEQCGARGDVYLIRDPFRGVASHALHEVCAAKFYDR
ncbi:hypothetical protein [Bradyrhizobium iriomotense]|uniref:DUF927 domain-containing protein n=1 Tax=Bradyrhizobium iriomotense TaxID=441950 RepID=A0ABQ6AX91_9BRAD|nr:hypothetical protein [Bradyrhizobium iriomotense]GLR85846.1 hypothetical protein GCM10007857_25570 [Bradyrhizobium iriomotense]